MRFRRRLPAVAAGPIGPIDPARLAEEVGQLARLGPAGRLPKGPPKQPGYCAGKVAHATEAAAQAAVEYHVRRGQAQPGAMEAYPCPHCYEWHVGRVIWGLQG